MKKIIPFFLLILLLASCQKDPDMSKLDNDFVVYTDHDSKADFKSFTTFYVPDSVLLIGSSEKPQYWTATEADDIITTLIGNMESRGYTRTMDKESADLGLQVSFVENVNYFTNWYNDYNNNYWWWGYPGYWTPNYWRPGWGPSWGYDWHDWYYPYATVYSYSVGSLLAEMVDLKSPAPKADTKLPVIWTAYMSGLLSGSDKLDTQLCIRALDQAFVQSSYLRK